MRAVTKPNFCKACMENLWLELLKRVNLVDGVSERCVPDNHETTSISHVPVMRKEIELNLIPLAHLRRRHDGSGEEHKNLLDLVGREDVASERYTVLWSKDGQPLEKHTNQTTIDLGRSDANDTIVGTYIAQVKFSSDAIRWTDDSALVGRVEYHVHSGC